MKPEHPIPRIPRTTGLAAKIHPGPTSILLRLSEIARPSWYPATTLIKLPPRLRSCEILHEVDRCLTHCHASRTTSTLWPANSCVGLLEVAPVANPVLWEATPVADGQPIDDLIGDGSRLPRAGRILHSGHVSQGP